MLASFRLPLLVLGLLALTACVSGPTPKERAELQHFTPAHQRVTSTDRFAVAPPDVLLIKAPLAPEVDKVEQQIAPDGTLHLDLLGRVAVAGKSPAEIEELLTAKLQTFYQNVKVQVAVKYESQWYYVFGETARSGPKRFTGRDTVIQALAEAQPTRLAWPERIYLIKPSADPAQRHVTVINLKDIIQHGDSAGNVLLGQDDIVYVPLNPLANVGVGIQNLLFPAQPVFQAASSARMVGF